MEYIQFFGGYKVVKIRLKRFGTQKRPYYRVVVQDSRKPRDGKCIEEIGTFMPIEAEDKQVSIDMDRANYWIGVGAQPTDIVAKLMNVQARKQAK
nr:30S ribosomal protein S16 [Treponema porcinum]